MKAKFTLLTLLMFLLSFSPSQACSMFCYTVEGKTMVGNNEDYTDPHTWMWTKPAKNDKYGAVYFGFGNFFAQGGINEAGLVFDGFAMESKPIKNTTGKKGTHPGALIQKVMSTCATVSQVQEVFEAYNISFLHRSQLMFVDKNGHSLIVEGDDMILSTQAYQITTNFYQSSTPKEDFHSVCHRYAKGDQILSKGLDSSLEYGEKVLIAMHQEGVWGGTQYSHLYDLNKGIIYLYLFHNYQERVELSVSELLAQEEQKTELITLFTQNQDYKKYRKAYDATNELQGKLSKIKNPQRMQEVLDELYKYPEAMQWQQQVGHSMEKLLEQEKYELALPIIQYSSRLFPKSWQLKALQAKSYFQLEEYEAARAQIDAALVLSPDDPGLLKAKEKILNAMK